MLIVNDLIGAQTEDKCIFFANFMNDLHIRAVHRSQCRSAVQHELHVAGTGGFLGCRRNLLRNIRCRENDLTVADLVVFDEHYLEAAGKRRIVIYGSCHGVDQLDDQLRDLIPGRCLCAEDKGPWIEIHLRMLLQLVAQVHDVHDIEQLPLVFVETLDLYVED